MNSNDLQQLETLLDKKQDQFTVYKDVSQELLNASVDSAEKYITMRQQLTVDIDATNDAINELCRRFDDAALAQDVAMARIDYDAVPVPLQDAYNQGQAIRSIALSVVEMDKQITERLKGFQQQAVEKIKENKSVPIIKRYLTDLGSEQADGTSHGKA